MITSPRGGKRLVIAYSFKKISFAVLLLSAFFVPIRGDFVKELYVVFLSFFGFFGFLFFKRYNKFDIFVISAPYFLCSVLILFSVALFSQSYSELRYIAFIFPSILVGVFVYGLFFNGGLSVFWAIKSVVVCGVALSVLCIFQYFNFFQLNDFYYEFLHDKRGVRYLLNDSRRVLGMYGNPNEVGLVLGVSLISLILFKCSFSRARFLVFLLIIVLGILTTGSRTAVLAVGFSLFLFYFYFLGFYGLLKFFSALVVLLSVVLVFSLNYLDFDYLIERSTNFRSLEARFEYLWMDAFSKGLERPIFGHGPARNIIGIELTPDSKWLTWWIQFGLFGVVCFFFYFLYLLLFLFKKEEFSSSSRLVSGLGFVVSLYFFIYAFIVDWGVPAITPMSMVFVILLSLALGGRRSLASCKVSVV